LKVEELQRKEDMRQFVEKDTHHGIEMVEAAEDVHLDSSVLESSES
jgi:hypothetical protein